VRSIQRNTFLVGVQAYADQEGIPLD